MDRLRNTAGNIMWMCPGPRKRKRNNKNAFFLITFLFLCYNLGQLKIPAVECPKFAGHVEKNKAPGGEGEGAVAAGE